PRIDPDPPELDPSKASPSETQYDLKGLAAWLERERGATLQLSSEVAQRKKSLDRLVEDYLARDWNFRRIDEHIKYHALWQATVTQDSNSYNSANELLAAYRIWRAPADDAAAKARIATARKK